MSGCLNGVRIVDLTANVSGPFGAAMLGDMGADVIKVEAPGLGDLSRYFGPIRGGMAAGFAVINRNKRAVAIDLQAADGRDVLLKLVQTADVVLQNFRPGVVDRLGVGYDGCRAVRPDIIYVSISGYGDSGPRAGDPVYDPVIQAASGYMMVQSDPGSGKPAPVRNIICDKIASMSVVQAVMGALFARERGGGGQHVKVAMLDTSLAFLWPDAMSNFTYIGEMPPMAEIGDMYNLPRSKDGYVIGFAITDAQYQGLCRALQRPDLAVDPRFVSITARVQHLEELSAIITAEIAKFTSAEIVENFSREQVPGSKINTRADLLSDAQIAHNELIVETQHPDAGHMRYTRPPIVFEGTPSSIRHHAPQLGGNTDELLTEIGISADEIAKLREKGAVG
ncbi:MAG: CaiB/BaiF CoA-transferase family protein [Alphaproteobacteria bacterium]|nr:CaiB/BaiF CoA-transferase family protein [Alphaproteobacteria bacterium]